jgi:hypothetical protein
MRFTHICFILALLIGVLPGTGYALSPDSPEVEQAERLQEQQKMFEQLKLHAQDVARIRWNRPAERVLPVYYRQHIGTAEDAAIFTALCGNDRVSCAQAEAELRTYAEACYVQIILVDLDLFDWGKYPSIPVPVTIYQAPDPTVVLLMRERMPGGYLGVYQTVDTTGKTVEEISALACGYIPS